MANLQVGQSHRVTATSYTSLVHDSSTDDATAGNTISVWFTVVNSATRPPIYTEPPNTEEVPSTKLILVDADSDQDIDVLTNRYLVEMAIFPRINIRAEPYPGFSTKSVVFSVDTKVMRIENTKPYAIMGNRGQDYFAWSPTEYQGMTLIEATPYSGKNGQGTAGPKAKISIVIRPIPPPA